MGIHFACHHCSHAMHVKDFLAGKRGRCPECDESFRIPLSDSQFSLDVNERVLEGDAKAAKASANQPSAAPVLASKNSTSKSLNKTSGATKKASSSIAGHFKSTSVEADSPSHTTEMDDKSGASKNRQAKKSGQQELGDISRGEKVKKGAQRAVTSDTNAESISLNVKSEFKSEKTAGSEAADLTKKRASKSKVSNGPSTPPSPPASQGTPRAFLQAKGARWYVRPPSGGEYGPANEELLTVWIEEKRVTGDSLLWREGQPQWIAAENLLPELFHAESDFYEEPTKVQSDSDSTIGYPEPKAGGSIKPSAASTETITTSAAALLKAQRRQRQKRNQWVIIAILAIVSISLLAGLVFVLFNNKTPTSQSSFDTNF